MSVIFKSKHIMMWEAPFVTTFQNKDNVLIYTKTICKSLYKMQKNIISFF